MSEAAHSAVPPSTQPPFYVGFWARALAELVDILLWAAIAYPLLIAIYGLEYFTEPVPDIKTGLVAGPADLVISWILPTTLTIGFWYVKQATPGKMLIRARIVHSTTGGRPSLGQCTGRYFAMFVSIFPLFLGLFWIAFDRRKQGWHDKLARTVVIRLPARPAAA